MESSPADDPRLIDLETRLAHQERMSEDLSDALMEQARVMGRLTLQLRQLHDRIGELEAGGRTGGHDERPPPHY